MNFGKRTKDNEKVNLNQKSIIISIISLIFGVMIYSLFRSTNIRIVKYTLFLIRPLINLRVYINLCEWPEWFIYNLVDGLWSLSYSILILDIMSSKRTQAIGLALIITIGYEGLQYINIISGTFDILDMLFSVVGVFIGYIILYKGGD